MGGNDTPLDWKDMRLLLKLSSVYGEDCSSFLITTDEGGKLRSRLCRGTVLSKEFIFKKAAGALFAYFSIHLSCSM